LDRLCCEQKRTALWIDVSRSGLAVANGWKAATRSLAIDKPRCNKSD
jgi:hypothetical protein